MQRGAVVECRGAFLDEFRWASGVRQLLDIGVGPLYLDTRGHLLHGRQDLGVIPNLAEADAFSEGYYSCAVLGADVDCVSFPDATFHYERPEPWRVRRARRGAGDLWLFGDGGVEVVVLPTVLAPGEVPIVSEPPEIHEPILDAVQVYGAGCALLADGVTCWGSSRFIPESNTVPPGSVEIDGMWNHACVRDAEGGVWCWGWSGVGDTHVPPGRRTPDLPILWPEWHRMELPRPATAISVAYFQSCALLDDGTAWCWGSNEHGQLFDGTTTDSESPVQVVIGEEP